MRTLMFSSYYQGQKIIVCDVFMNSKFTSILIDELENVTQEN